MIDTDKYEGHTGPWKPHTIQPLYGNMVLFGFNEQDSMLSADAPLLLAEVKRLEDQTWQANADYIELEKEVKRLREDIVSILGAIDLPDYDEFPFTQEELRNMMTKYGQEHLICEGEE